MPEFRRDPITSRWVIIATDRQNRPSSFQRERIDPIEDCRCPFCEGFESDTPPEVLAYREGGEANGPGWQVRVVPNLYPALQMDGGLDRQGEGLFDKMNGVGAHEVIIETPDHDATLASLPPAAVERVLRAYRDRVLDLKQDRRFRYILIFKNHGAPAGATLAHPHSQLIALPIVPRQVRDEIAGARHHHQHRERCVYCDIVRQELGDRRRVVSEADDFVVLSPYAPRFPFETWIVPRRHNAFYEEAEPHEYTGLAHILGDTLRRLERALGAPAFNLIVHSSPFTDNTAEYYHWHLEIMPKLTRVAGFEWGSGFYINPTSPEEAAAVLGNGGGVTIDD
jgi:UDPglucose--hexose-1-phosphate uridylyltransferase